MLNSFLTILFVLVSINLSFSQQSLKDSLLMIYSEQQLKHMSSRELGNAVRKMRGQKALPPTPLNTEWPDTDKYGFKIIDNINSDSLEQVIGSRISNVDANVYSMKIFPNSYVDIINRFEYGFYEDLKTRKLRHESYHRLHYDYEGDEAFKLVAYTNNSRRIYCLDDKDSIQKIILETGKSVNEGEPYDWDLPMQYQKTIFYLWKGDLQYVEQLFIGEDFYGDLATLKEDSSTYVEVRKFYFYKNNCISSYKAQSRILKNIIDPTEGLEYVPQYCDNVLAAHLKNYILEYIEYDKGLNDYLKPHEGSHSQPSVQLK